MAQPCDARQKELFRPALDQIIDGSHPLVRLARTIDWDCLDREFGGVFKPGAGHPPLPVRLMAGLLLLKHMYTLSDEALCARWIENPYFQYFCGEQVFRHDLGFDRSSLSRWRRRLGPERLAALIQQDLPAASTARLPSGNSGRVAVALTA